MVIQTELGIAIKNIAGKYEIIDFSLFHPSKINTCSSLLKIHRNKNRIIMFNINCPICNNVHKYSYSIDEFFKREIIVGGCEVLGIPLFYIGNKDTIKIRAYKQNDIINKTYMMV